MAPDVEKTTFTPCGEMIFSLYIVTDIQETTFRMRRATWWDKVRVFCNNWWQKTVSVVWRVMYLLEGKR